MGKIFINKLTFSGQIGTSTIEFAKNLTVIIGPSDTGKSYIFKSIYYLLGAKSESKPFDTSIGYDTIEMDLKVSNSIYILKRKIGDSEITVTKGSKVNSYTTSTSKSSSDHIDNLFADILGIDRNLKVPKNENGKTQKFTIRTLKQLLMVSEDMITVESSILLPDQKVAITPFLSCLLYILYKSDFSEYNEDENKKVKYLKKTVIKSYIQDEINKIIKRREKAKKELGSISESTRAMGYNIQNLEMQFEDVDTTISKYVDAINIENSKLINLNDLLLQKQTQIKRYEILEMQYISDIQRLNFIIEGEDIIQEHKTPDNCPFCGGVLNAEIQVSCLESAKAEVKTIISNSEQLSDFMKEIELEINEITEDISICKGNKEKIQKCINNDLEPLKEKIKDRLDKYTNYINLVNELSAIEAYILEKQEDLDQIDYLYENTTVIYKPKDLFADDFVNCIKSEYFKILKECNYTPRESVEFDMASFDIIINGVKKSTHGKGYRAFFNSILILAFRNYINATSLVNPHFYMIDSPLNGLKLPNEVSIDSDTRKGFFEYLSKNYNDDQIIIIENINVSELHPNYQSDPNIKVIEFTQNENVGRYGLLENIKKK